jgi:hypothetical protein
MGVTFEENQWNRIHGDNKSVTGGSIHSETMVSANHGPQVRVLHYNKPKFQESVKADDDENQQKIEVIAALKAGLDVSLLITSSINIDRNILGSDLLLRARKCFC